jgi:hypothetical protein
MSEIWPRVSSIARIWRAIRARSSTLRAARTVSELVIGDAEQPGDRNLGHLDAAKASLERRSENLGAEIGGELAAAGPPHEVGEQPPLMPAVELAEGLRALVRRRAQQVAVARRFGERHQTASRASTIGL